MKQREERGNSERIAILGLGYVGLPLALAFAEAGHTVIGYEISPERVALINAGYSYIDDIASERLASVVEQRRLLATSEPADLRSASAVIICVPTPLTKQRIPDMRWVEQAAKVVAGELQRGQLIVLESTTYPGTTNELLIPILETSGLTAGTDFSVAFSPERVDPGATSSSGFNIRNTPKIVGGLTPACTDRAVALYGSVVDQVVPVNSPHIAEMAKLFENIFRNVNIALVNELTMLCHKMDLNVWEVLDAAGTKPFGFMKFSPGPGVGGHCIPVDPFYLTWKAREYGVHTRFIELAGEINDSMPSYVVSRITDALNVQQKSLNGSSILAIGVAYKPNISDIRESPALRVVEELIQLGATVRFHDPHVAQVSIANEALCSVPLTAAEIADADCVVILTDHDAIDYGLISDNAELVVDTRRRIARRQTEAVVRVL
jgi:UDP-N-acetyl-D-glucosamine dehydrogenase